MLTGNRLTGLAKAALAICATMLIGLLLIAPASWQAISPLSDKEMHALAFYGLALLSGLAFPTRRRTDLVFALAVIGLGLELAQGLVGRDAELSDALADLVGAGAVLLPGWVERLRAACRQAPDVSIGVTLKAAERRVRARPAPRPQIAEMAQSSPIARLIEADRRARIAARFS